ncbi:hypothetical protein AAC387_Pa01g0880 [Persea americana]
MLISRNVIFLEQIPFFSLHLDSHPIVVSYLPQFSESASPSPLPKVYVQRNTVPPLATPSPDPLLAPPTKSSGNYTSSDGTISLQRSSRPSVAPNHYGFPALLTSLDRALIPTLYSQASKIVYWQDAMTEELVALEANQTWELVPAPDGACDWQQMDILHQSTL